MLDLVPGNNEIYLTPAAGVRRTRRADDVAGRRARPFATNGRLAGPQSGHSRQMGGSPLLLRCIGPGPPEVAQQLHLASWPWRPAGLYSLDP